MSTNIHHEVTYEYVLKWQKHSAMQSSVVMCQCASDVPPPPAGALGSGGGLSAT